MELTKTFQTLLCDWYDSCFYFALSALLACVVALRCENINNNTSKEKERKTKEKELKDSKFGFSQKLLISHMDLTMSCFDCLVCLMVCATLCNTKPWLRPSVGIPRTKETKIKIKGNRKGWSRA